MKLHNEWKAILKKAWSIRLGVLAATLSGAEVVMPLFQDSLPRGVFAVLSFLAVSGAVTARLISQENLSG